MTPEGVQLTWSPFQGSDKDVVRNVAITGNFWSIRHAANKIVANTFMTGGQIKFDVSKATVAGGLYYFSGLNQAANLGVNAQMQSIDQMSGGRYAKDKMAVVTGKARLPFSIKGFPVAVGGEIIYNVVDDTTKQRYGYEASVEMPKVGTGSLVMTWRELAQNATYAGWSDSDLGEGTGYHAGARVKWTVPVNKSVDFMATYFHYDRFQPNTLPRRANESTNRIFLEAQAKF